MKIYPHTKRELCVKGLQESADTLKYFVAERYLGYTLGAVIDAIDFLKREDVIHSNDAIEGVILRCPSCKVQVYKHHGDFCPNCGRWLKWE